MKGEQRPDVLLIDDDAVFLSDVAVCLEGKFNVVTAQSGAEGLSLLSSHRFEAILLDLHLGTKPDGFETLREIKRLLPFLPVIVVSQDKTPNSQQRATYLGASAYLYKSNYLLLYGGVIERAIRNALVERRDSFTRRVYAEEHPTKIIGHSLIAEKLRIEVARLAMVDLPVFIRGETGSGKDLCARAIHSRSSRKEANLIIVDCPSIPENLAESELFGHVKGAYTGAPGSIGKFGEADGGTIFLNEIGMLSPPLQAKLLSFLDSQTISRVGSSRSVPIDARVISATNENIEEALLTGRFRKDLFARLDVCRLHIPPLRERLEDIAELAEYFLKRAAPAVRKAVSGVSPEAVELISQYHWPQNVRELRSFVFEALTHAEEPMLLPEDFLLARPELKKSLSRSSAGETLLFDYEDACLQLEKQFIEKALSKSRGNVSLAAKELAYSRQHFSRLMRKHGINENLDLARK